MKDQLGALHVDREAKPVAILTAPVRISSILLAGLCAATALWGVLAKIPVRVNGLAVLVSTEGFYQVVSPGSGRVIYPFLKSPDGKYRLVSLDWSRKAHDLIYSSKSHSEKDLKRLAADIANSNPGVDFARFSKTNVSGGFGTGGDGDQLYVKRGQLLAVIDSPSARSEISTNLASLLVQEETSRELRIRLKETLQDSSEYNNSKSAQLDRMKKVFQQGGLSESDYLAGLADVQRSKQSISEIKTRIAELDQTIELQRKQLSKSLAAFVSRSFIFAKDNAEISQVMLNQNAEVSPGQVLMTLNWDKEVAPDQIPIFFDQQAASQISPGMKSISTPMGFSSSEIGGIVGQVVDLDPYPVSPSEITSRLGSQGLAQLIVQAGGLFQADVKLTRDDVQRLGKLRSAYRDKDVQLSSTASNNRSGYLWNNKSRPPISPREGFILTTQVTTRYRTPLEMLMPSIYEILGISSPDKLIKQNLNQKSQ